MVAYTCWFLLSVLSCITAADNNIGPSGDRITNLPGYTDNLPFRQYSGYLRTQDNKRLFYWFVESEKNFTEDPLIVWFNGGPGCSSLGHVLEGNGPFRVNPDAETLRINHFRWNKISNLLYIESPAGVGFTTLTASDAENWHQNEEREKSWNYKHRDENRAWDDNYFAIKDFFGKFPALTGNPVYVFGHSYGAVYATKLSIKLKNDETINFVGLGIVNGLVSYKYMFQTTVHMAYHFGYVTEQNWQSHLKTCCSDPQGRVCDRCHENLTWVDALDMGYECINSSATILYLNEPRVQEALHVSNFFIKNGSKWFMCKRVWKDYTKYIKKELGEEIRALAQRGYQVIMLYGDADLMCSALAARWFLNSIQLPMDQDLRLWYYTGDSKMETMGGGHIRYSNLDFYSIQGAGHGPSIDAPEKAYAVFQRFINTSHGKTLTIRSLTSQLVTNCDLMFLSVLLCIATWV